MEQWEKYWTECTKKHHNFVFLGEAGSGKSEVALNLAFYLASVTQKSVHFFDLDMTKPLFRSRDLAGKAQEAGIRFHYEQQFMDTPIQVGGVRSLMRDPESLVILDVGGNDTGARAIGGYAPELNRDGTAVFFVVNPYRPWSDTIGHIDETLGKILGVSHIGLDRVRLISNPNTGGESGLGEFEEGSRWVEHSLGPYREVELCCVRRELFPEAQKSSPGPVMPLNLYLQYSWMQEELEDDEGNKP